MWVGSFTEHCFYGDGSLAKISDGQNFQKNLMLEIYINSYILKKKTKLIGDMIFKPFTIWKFNLISYCKKNTKKLQINL